MSSAGVSSLCSSASSVSITPRENCSVGPYRVIRRLGKGGYGTVYLGKCQLTLKEVAIKFECIHHASLVLERLVYAALCGGVGIPRVFWCGRDRECNVLVMDRLGPSLDDLREDSSTGRFSLKTALMLADQMLQRIEYVHGRDFVHRDIKPENFAMGMGSMQDVVYLLDFGCAETYREDRSKSHVRYSCGQDWVGTLCFLSMPCHCGVDRSRRDDMESFAYTLLYLLRGDLPWEHMEGPQEILSAKTRIPAEVICAGFPREIEAAYRYCRSLSFSEKPDYSYLRGMLRCLFLSKRYAYDNHFDWVPPLGDTSYCNRCEGVCNYAGTPWNPILVPE